ncbi:MAG: hypothetical protein PHO08_14215 [Methylococcales bacterium]|nr:hypothetical protein [Methylococcales bacterium]MDD5630967.1 hypothetical protein [Methylococcales bacterium]
MKTIHITLSIAPILLFLSSCATVTTIDGTWTKPEAVAQKYHSIVVLGLSNDLVIRSTIEKSIIKELTKNGYHAVAGSAILPANLIDVDSDGKLDKGAKEIIANKLKAAGVDGALVFVFKNIEKSISYVPGTYSYTPAVGMYGFRGYYGGMYNYMYGGAYNQTPGYYVQNLDYEVTTNFYSVADDQLLWSALSGTMNPASLSDFAASYGSALVKSFLESGIVRQ